jgi:5-methylcytosine-specific restriction endonuclease McrA
MNNLRNETVLVLNRCWQAINVKSPTEAISMMYDDSATALDIRGDDYMVPLKWEDWISLPHDEDSSYIHTVSFEVKIPKVIVLAKFDRVPKKRPKFTAKNIWLRDNGVCQYSGKKLSPNEANIDHVLPKSRGGLTNWTNCVLAHKEINAKKADKTPEESGLKLLRKPVAPKELPVTFYIRNKHNIKEWDVFLKDFARNE